MGQLQPKGWPGRDSPPRQYSQIIGWPGVGMCAAAGLRPAGLVARNAAAVPSTAACSMLAELSADRVPPRRSTWQDRLLLSCLPCHTAWPAYLRRSALPHSMLLPPRPPCPATQTRSSFPLASHTAPRTSPPPQASGCMDMMALPTRGSKAGGIPVAVLRCAWPGAGANPATLPSCFLRPFLYTMMEHPLLLSPHSFAVVPCPPSSHHVGPSPNSPANHPTLLCMPNHLAVIRAA